MLDSRYNVSQQLAVPLGVKSFIVFGSNLVRTGPVWVGTHDLWCEIFAPL